MFRFSLQGFSRYVRFRAAILSCLIAGTIAAADPAAPAKDSLLPEFDHSITSILPADTILWLATPDWAATTARFQQLPMMRLLASDEMKPFLAQTTVRGNDLLIDSYGLDFSSIEAESSGEFIVAGLTTSSGELSITCFIETADEASAARFIKLTTELLVTRGAQRETAETPDTQQLVLKNINERLVLGTLGAHAMISGDVGVAKRLTQSWRQQSDTDSPAKTRGSSLIQKPSFCETLTSHDAVPPTVLRWYFDPIAFAVASEVTAKRRENAITPNASASIASESSVPFPMRHGFPGLQSITGRAWINEQTGNLESRSLIYAPKRENAMAMFRFEPGPLEIPDWIDKEVNVATMLRWNLKEMITHLESVYDDVTDAPGAFQGTMQDLKSQLKVDLIGEMFPVLGPELAVVTITDPMQNIESNVVSIEIKDPQVNEKNVARMIYNLLISDPDARQIRLPGKRYELWQIKLIVDEDSTPFTKAGLIVANGRLWFSTHATTLQQLLLQQNTKPLAETNTFKAFQQVIEGERDANSVGFSLARMDRDAKQTYEVLRAEGIAGLDNVESVYASMLRGFFSSFQPNDDVASVDVRQERLDFSVLPNYDFVRTFLNNLAIISRNTESGWEVFAVVFDEEAP
jgi:hypothetical protein